MTTPLRGQRRTNRVKKKNDENKEIRATNEKDDNVDKDMRKTGTNEKDDRDFKDETKHRTSSTRTARRTRRTKGPRE